MHHQSDSDYAVAEEYTEVFTDRRISEKILAGSRCKDEQKMEQYTSKQSLCIRRAYYGCTAYQNRSACIQADLSVRSVRLECSHVLYEDQLSPACQNHGENGRYNADMVYIDTGSVRYRTVLSDSAELLSELRPHNYYIKETKQCY